MSLLKKDSKPEKAHKYDVGVTGWWYNENYGGTMTYYALNRVLQSMGRSVLMIARCTNDPNYRHKEDSVPFRFAKKYYNISKNYTHGTIGELNDMCDTFISGSDQLFNPVLWQWSGPQYFLNYAGNDKRIISYASSFGNEFYDNKGLKVPMKNWLDRFDAISVREDYGVDICKDVFGIKAKHVLDPVFLCDVAEYEKLADSSPLTKKNDYMLSFFLDPDEAKRQCILDLSEKLGLPYVNLLNADHVESNIEKLHLDNTFPSCDIEDWVFRYKNADFVITDSFHGTCFAIIFRKKFISVANHGRGVNRFISVLEAAGLRNRLVNDISEIKDRPDLFEDIDYDAVYKKLDPKIKESLKWLKNALNAPIKKKENAVPVPTAPKPAAPKGPANPLEANPDFVKIRMLATLLRDYGIKHVVLSPGGRDVPLVRMFEYHEGTFNIHRVTDERSAAYYGLGIAAQLQEPVACVCTSGTAASNYLPAVTEAYFTGVPLIMITADRREIYHGHGEDQTIPQKHIFDGVIKKSISLPEGGGYQADYQTRRDIQECILEATHNGFGPVHINISIDNITVGAGSPREHWALLPFVNPHIQRVGPCDGDQRMMDWANALKNSKRILISYGQNARPSAKQLENIRRFAEKYNCVFATDFISNLDEKYCVKPFNMLLAMSQEEFNNTLAPDILISVGGKQLMNDPLTFKIRGGRGTRHWSVAPDGRVKDFFFRLTSVLEMSQDYFFEWFADHAGDIKNDESYYNTWVETAKKYAAPEITKFNAHHVQSKFIPAVPANSVLHLGVGQSFYDCRRYTMQENVSVFCNMGTNGIDGCTSTFMGQCAVEKDKLCFLLVGDLSFFYDMNGIWNKPLTPNMRILLVNNNGSGLLSGHNLKGIRSVHNTRAEGWVKSTGFEYMSASSPAEYEKKLKTFLSDKSDKALFFEVFCD